MSRKDFLRGLGAAGAGGLIAGGAGGYFGGKSSSSSSTGGKSGGSKAPIVVGSGSPLSSTATGPILGTILVQIVATVLVTRPGAEFTILGLFLLVVVIFVPDGLAGLIGRDWRKVGAWAAEDDQPEGSPDPHVA